MRGASYSVNLSNFSGPLDLLLELIEKKQLDICDVSLAQVTDDYLEFIRNAKLNQHSVNRFLEVAAQLILVKSQALLPNSKNELIDEQSDDLTQQLKILAQYKLAIKNLYSNPKFLQLPTISTKHQNRQLAKIDIHYLAKQYSSLIQLQSSSKTYRLKRRYDKLLKQTLTKKLLSLKSIEIAKLGQVGNDKTESVVIFLIILDFIKAQKAKITTRGDVMKVNFV